MARRVDLVLIACIALTLTTAGAEEPYNIMSKIPLTLPSDSTVKVRWVCPPIDEQLLDREDGPAWYDFRFAVDASGNPWLVSPDDNLILNPAKQYRFSLSHPFKDILCLDNGAVLFQTERDLGFVGAADAPVVADGKVTVPFQPAVSLPLPFCRVDPGTGNCLYVTGVEPDGNYGVYLLEPEQVRPDGAKILRSFRKVFECPEPITAVAGDGEITFAAFGRVIARVGRQGQKEPDVIVHPTNDVTDMAYLPGAGLFYATDFSVGVATESGDWDFLSCFSPQIDLRGGTLYVLFKDMLAVVAFDNAADLTRYQPTTSADSQEHTRVEVAEIWFDGTNVDPNISPTRDTEFDNETTDYVTGGLRLHPTAPLDEKTHVTVLWSYFGDTDSDSTVVDLTGGQDVTMTSTCGVGWTSAARRNPGPYTMQILIDGVSVATGSFEMHGKPSVIDVIHAEDTQMLKYMLEHGADPEERDTDLGNCTALAWAAGFDVRAVELLLEHGAQVDARGGNGQTPLFYTHLCDSPAMAVEIAETLIRHGADINAVDNYGTPLLLYLARHGAPELVELLLKRGVNPNLTARRDSVETPSLVWLLQGRYHEPQEGRTLELLLSYGANPNARDGAVAQWCPLYLVIDDPEPEYVQMLLRYGASLGESFGGTSSALQKALQVYLDSAATDRVKAQKAKDVTAILLQHGATLRPQEETTVADTRLHTWLPPELILSILKRNDQAVLDTTDSTSAAIQRMVVNRLIEMAIAKAAAATSNDGYSAALALCDQAKTRAERWQMQAQCPLIYYNTGLLYRHLGQVPAASENFRRYLELVPNAPEADTIRTMLR